MIHDGMPNTGSRTTAPPKMATELGVGRTIVADPAMAMRKTPR